MNGNLCRDCGLGHRTSLDALRCTERMADACGCGHCPNCKMAASWRAHPKYEPPPEQPNTRS